MSHAAAPSHACVVSSSGVVLAGCSSYHASERASLYATAARSQQNIYRIAVNPIAVNPMLLLFDRLVMSVSLMTEPVLSRWNSLATGLIGPVLPALAVTTEHNSAAAAPSPHYTKLCDDYDSWHECAFSQQADLPYVILVLRMAEVSRVPDATCTILIA